MDTDTYSNADVTAYVKETFVALKLDGDRESKLVASLGLSGYPSVFLLSPDGELLGRIEGYEDPRPFLDRLKKIGAQILRLGDLRKVEAPTLAHRKEIADLYFELDLPTRAAEAFQAVLDHPDADRKTRAEAYTALLEIGSNSIRAVDSDWVPWLEKRIAEVRAFDPENASDLLDDASFAEFSILALQRKHEKVIELARAAYDKYLKSDRADCLLFQVAKGQRRAGRREESLQTLKDLAEKHPETSCGRRAREMLGKQE
jgi:tetratricopeptide (TPR) repeat protein